MTRPLLFAFAVSLLSLAGCHKTKSAIRQRQEAVVQSYDRLPQAAKAKAEASARQSGQDLRGELLKFDGDTSREMDFQTELHIQAVIDRELKPVPIVNGAFQPALQQEPNPEAPALSMQQQQLLLSLAASVGRLQTSNGAWGTAFLVGRNQQQGLIATNCHLIDNTGVTPTIPDPVSGSPVPPGAGFQVDFDDTPLRTPAKIFSVLRAMPCAATGLDVALLTTSLTSIDGAAQLPSAQVSLLGKRLNNNFAASSYELVGIVGYPALNLANPNDDATGLFAQFDNTKYAKFYSPGGVHRIVSNRGVDFLYHTGSTMTGYSGGPMLDIASGAAVGLNACCTPVGAAPTPARLPCAQQLLPGPPANNVGVSSWSAVADPALKKTLASFGIPVS